jgi:hypothetical protein
MNDDTLRFAGCDSCSFSVCDGTCESPSISTAIDDAIVANILAEQAAFAASLPPREERECACDGDRVVLSDIGRYTSVSGEPDYAEVACPDCGAL